MRKGTISRTEADFLSMMNSFSLPKEPFCILLGYSGGADSSALLSLLNAHSTRFGYTLYAVHVNHMIRGDEADRDEEFCRETCKELGIPFFLHKADVPALAKEQKRGLEETARIVRYAAFDEISEKLTKDTGMPVLTATAHNADDNTETLLFNLTRGSALSGLCGIASQRDNIIRPLILSAKEEICGYCDENRVKYITDSTNSDTAYTRNKIRHLVLPTLREINPALSRAVSRTTASLTDDNDYLSSVTDAFILGNTKDGKTPVSAVCSLHPAIRSRVILKLLRENGACDLTDAHVSAVSSLCENARPHSKSNLHGGISAVIENGMLCFAPTVNHGSDSCEYDIPLGYGITKIEQTGAVFARFDSDDKENIEKFKNIYKIFIQTLITSDKIIGALHLRTRRSGDVYSINGVNRKLKKLLWELESDPKARDTLPLVCDGDGILWVPGARSRTETYPKHGEASQTLFYVKNKDVSTAECERIGTSNDNA